LDIVSHLSEQRHFRSSEVSFHGLSIVIPFINKNSLKDYTDICAKYYEVLYFLCRYHTDKISRLPQQVFIAIINTIQISLKYFDNTLDVLKNTLQAVSLILEFFFDSKYNKDIVIFGENQYAKISNLLENILSLLFIQQFKFHLFELFSKTLFGLICLNQNLYIDLCHELVFHQEEDVQSSLRSAIEDLNRAMPNTLIYDEQNLRLFIDNFKLFLLRTRAVIKLKI